MKTSDDLAKENYHVTWRGGETGEVIRRITALIEAHVKAACALATAAERDRKDIK